MCVTAVDLTKLRNPHQDIVCIGIIVIRLLDLIKLSERPRVVSHARLILPVTPIAAVTRRFSDYHTKRSIRDLPADVEVNQMGFENLGADSPIHVKIGTPKARDILSASIRHEPCRSKLPHTGVDERNTRVPLHHSPDGIVRIIQVESLPVAQRLCALLRPQDFLPAAEVEQTRRRSCFSRQGFRRRGLAFGLVVSSCTVAWLMAESLASPEEKVTPKEFEADPVDVALDVFVELSLVPQSDALGQPDAPEMSQCTYRSCNCRTLQPIYLPLRLPFASHPENLVLNASPNMPFLVSLYDMALDPPCPCPLFPPLTVPR